MARSITTISKVLKFVKARDHSIHESRETGILGFKPISSAGKGDMTFCSAVGEKGERLVRRSGASLVICPVGLKKNTKDLGKNLIFVENPRLWFLRCVKNFSDSKRPVGIHRTAILESKKFGRNFYMGPHSFIGRDVSIGDNVVIHGGVHIYGNTRIGNNVTIDSSTVIGADGFGFERNEKGAWEKFPHLGWVEIHDDVEIGANVCIDRGTLEGTIIGNGTKIDNLVHVAHNVKIGSNCAIVAQSLLGGSSVLEDNVYVSMCALVRDGIRIGNGAFVGMGAVVTRDVPKGVTVIGVPAHPMRIKK